MGDVKLEEPRKNVTRKALLARGYALATLLAEVLAGKASEARVNALGLGGKPGERPAEKLRRALDQIEARRKLLEGDDDRFGRCDVCGVDLGEAEIGELPWADRCRAHAAV